MYTDIIKSIIAQQGLVIGPVAVEEANKVPGLSVSKDGREVTLTEDGKIILEKLVNQYTSLFGRVSIEVCKEAIAISTVSASVQKDNLPEILR